MKISFWGKALFSLSIAETCVLIIYQGIMGQPFSWAAAFNTGIIGFCLGFALRSINLKIEIKEEKL